MKEYEGISLTESDFKTINKIEYWVEEPLEFKDFYAEFEPYNLFYSEDAKILDLIVSGKDQEIPLELLNLDALRNLIIIETPIKTLPEELSLLTSLKRLHILMCKGFSELPETIGDLKSLVELSIEECGLRTIPDTIKDLPNLQVLHLNGNNLIYLPESIGYLKSLEYLFLMNNQLKILPESISNLINLKSLNLESNRISSLPNSFKNLQLISFLNFGDNELEDLPEEIMYLNSLEYLDLSGNNLKVLPDLKLQKTPYDQLSTEAKRIYKLTEQLTQLKNRGISILL